MPVALAGLKQQDLDVRLVGQAARHDAASRSAADDDVVVQFRFSLMSNRPCLSARPVTGPGLFAPRFSTVRAPMRTALVLGPRDPCQKRSIDRPPSGLRTEPVAKLRRPL